MNIITVTDITETKDNRVEFSIELGSLEVMVEMDGSKITIKRDGYRDIFINHELDESLEKGFIIVEPIDADMVSIEIKRINSYAEMLMENNHKIDNSIVEDLRKEFGL